eukprot:7386172-Prymnesium_polylepis.1
MMTSLALMTVNPRCLSANAATSLLPAPRNSATSAVTPPPFKITARMSELLTARFVSTRTASMRPRSYPLHASSVNTSAPPATTIAVSVSLSRTSMPSTRAASSWPHSLPRRAS